MFGQIAQLVERGPEKAGVGGSNPSLATTPLSFLFRGLSRRAYRVIDGPGLASRQARSRIKRHSSEMSSELSKTSQTRLR